MRQFAPITRSGSIDKVNTNPLRIFIDSIITLFFKKFINLGLLLNRMRASYNPFFCLIFLLIATDIAFKCSNLIYSVRISPTLSERTVCNILNSTVDKFTYLIFNCRIRLLFFLFQKKSSYLYFNFIN